MDVLIFVVVLAGLTAFVVAPLYRRRPPPPAQEQPDARYDELIAALRELEVDHATGALDDATYEAERARLETDAAALLRSQAEH